jgi:hypothetical protein
MPESAGAVGSSRFVPQAPSFRRFRGGILFDEIFALAGVVA